MGVLPGFGRAKIQTGGSSASSAVPSDDDQSGRTTPAMSVDGAPPPPPVCPVLVRRNIGYRLKMKGGRRSKQRFENERTLMTMFGVETDCETGLDVHQSRSYFSDMLEGENGHLLDNFLSNEESKYFNMQEEEEEEEKDDVGEEKFEAEHAFLKIGYKLRCALKRNVPLGMLRGIEDSLNQTFEKDPLTEYVCELNSFERLLVHALSAYNSLNSYSFDSAGKRLVRVENPKPVFNKKDPTLTDYLMLRNNLE